MGWQEDKACFEQMPIEIKRDQYRNKGYYTLQTVQTWADYYQEHNHNKSLAAQILSDAKIDSSLNEVLSKKVSVFFGDITTLEVDVIVNAANCSLLGGGGVDGAIHRAAGKTMLEECKTLGGCKTGECKITGGYKLPAKYVIHAVGPRGEKPDLLRRCYTKACDILLKERLRSIAFPCISTGIYGYPNLSAAEVAIPEIRRIMENQVDDIDRVIFCLFLGQDVKVYEGLLQSYFPIK